LLYPSCPAVTSRFSKGLDIDAACGQLVAGRPVSEATKKKRKSAIR
jgi:adenine C2-methylase RlmN of 23S rRNA A2503 and tRNA A37